MCFTSGFAVLHLPYVLNLSLVFGICDIISDGIMCKTSDTRKRSSVIVSTAVDTTWLTALHLGHLDLFCIPFAVVVFKPQITRIVSNFSNSYGSLGGAPRNIANSLPRKCWRML